MMKSIVRVGAAAAIAVGLMSSATAASSTININASSTINKASDDRRVVDLGSLATDGNRLADLLVPDHVEQFDNLARSNRPAVSKSTDREIVVSVSIPDRGRVTLESVEDQVLAGTVPIVGQDGFVVEHRDYLVWTGHHREGDISIRFSRRLGDQRWDTLGATLHDTVNDVAWRLAPADARAGRSTWTLDEPGGYVEGDTTQWEIPAGEKAPSRSAEPEAELRGSTEARTADIVVMAANGVTIKQALDDSLAGVADFNTSTNNSHTSTSPINNVSIRLVALAWLNDNQDDAATTDLSQARSYGDKLRAAFGADLAIAIYPRRWANNTPGDGRELCGGWYHLGTTGIIAQNKYVWTSWGTCNQSNKRAFAHEVGHGYDGRHADAVSNPKSLMAGGDSGRGRYFSAANAARVHTNASTIRNRRTYTGGASATADGRYVKLSTPARVFDTRNNTGGTAVLLGNTPQPISLIAHGIPANANAVAINLTVAGPTGVGHVEINRTSNFSSVTSSVANFNPTYGTKATGTIVTPGDYGVLWARTVGASTHVIIDVMGYFTPNSGTGLNIVTPTRICDTRPAPTDPTGTCGTVALGANGNSWQEYITTSCPNGSNAAAVNITAAGPAAAGHMSAAASTAGLGSTSVINYSTGSGTIANFAIVPLNSAEKFYLKGYIGSTHAIVDLLGCFGPGGLDYRPNAAPVRRIDTRPNYGPGGTNWITANETQVINTQTAGSVAFVNMTVAEQNASSHLTAWPTSGSRPNTSNLNFGAGPPRNNFTIVDAGSNSDIRITRGKQSGGTYLIVDQFGWFH